jgi:hypothetical protein
MAPMTAMHGAEFHPPGLMWCGLIGNAKTRVARHGDGYPGIRGNILERFFVS